MLEAHGLGLESVVDVHAFLVDMKRDFATFNAEYAAAFGSLPEVPVRTTVEVDPLPASLLTTCFLCSVSCTPHVICPCAMHSSRPTCT